MNCLSITVALLLLVPSYVCTMENSKSAIIYQKATDNHVGPLVELINTQAIHDSTKIVIVPEKFRQMCVERGLPRTFIALANNNELVAYKKAFIINDPEEYNDITKNEIRCHGEAQHLVDAHIIDSLNSKKSIDYKDIPLISHENSITLYLGGDFTAPAYRNNGINSKLTQYALNSKVEEVQRNLAGKSYIVILYGLTQANSGDFPGTIDRSPSIIKQVAQFIAAVTGKKPVDALHTRYKAFMPTFDPESTELKPLPDEQSVDGYGNVLTYRLLEEQ